MNNVIILDDDSKSYTRLFFDYSNNALKVKGYKIVGNKMVEISNDDLSDLKEIFFPNNYKYQYDEDVYKVYGDSNGFNHFFKDGKEDFIRFLEKNDIGAYLYSSREYDNYSLERTYKFKKGRKKFVIKIVSVTALASMMMFIATQIHDKQITIFDEAFDSSISTTTEMPGTYSSSDEYITADELIGLINSSKLDDEQKKMLASEDLLNDVIGCYKGTIMEFLIKEKLQDLTVIYYEDSNEKGYTRLGFYNIADGNLIYINENYSYELSLRHEFVHLLQNPNCSKFFAETMADLVSKEYLGQTFMSYDKQDYLLKLLVDTIGPGPIWEYTFGGDISYINGIIRNNMSSEDSERLYYLLFEADDFSEEFNNELESLINMLYININHSDIKNNPNLFDQDGNYIDQRIYFNTHISQQEKLENNHSR